MNMFMNYAFLVLAFTLCMSISGSYEELVTICRKFNPEMEFLPDCEGGTVTMVKSNRQHRETKTLTECQKKKIQEITKQVVDELTKNFTTTLDRFSEKIAQAKSRLHSKTTNHKTLSASSHVNPPKSCDYINGTVDQSGVYVISPNSSIVAPFSVYCNFTGTAAETIISHHSRKEISVDKCRRQRCYKRKIKYDVTLAQAVALIEQSQSCRQFIKYRCTHSVLFRQDKPTYATWLSRDGTEQLYWGGATSRRNRYCACGETGTCVDNKLKCNCDKNLTPETSDEGYLIYKDSLPVTELQFGDTDRSFEHGWHTLGPLACSGRIR